MVRAPCCEKMGLKKGPWSPEEDQFLLSYIEKHGHGNWRALPKQAGLLRCGKSCRLRWINYLRPDIKRGNFTVEEEETIIKLHEKLGNRWSAIAAKLPGRTDNEIKNVWHTHLKKRLQIPNQPTNSDAKTRGSRSKPSMKRSDSSSSTVTTKSEPTSFTSFPEKDAASFSACTASSSDFSSSVLTVGESKKMDMVDVKREDDMESLETFLPEIDESFWSEAMDDSGPPTTIKSEVPVHQYPFDSTESFQQGYGYSSNLDDEMIFWYDIFIRSGESIELPPF